MVKQAGRPQRNIAERGPRGDREWKITTTTKQPQTQKPLLLLCHVNSLHSLICGLFSKFPIAPDIHVLYVYLGVVVEQVFSLRGEGRDNRHLDYTWFQRTG